MRILRFFHIYRSFFFMMTTAIFLILTWGCKSEHMRENSDKNIVFLISVDPDNYEADKSIPQFASQLGEKYDYRTRVLISKGERSKSEFLDLMEVLDDTDLLVVFCRRLALADLQMDRIQDYITKGNPVLGIRTANHSFSSFPDDEIPSGYRDWPEFVPEILGCENRGYGPVPPGTNISVVGKNNEYHSIVQGLSESSWHTIGNVYKVAPLLDPDAHVLMYGEVMEDEIKEPVAWVRTNKYGGKVFYTSLGHPADFENDNYIDILNQAIVWLLHNDN